MNRPKRLLRIAQVLRIDHQLAGEPIEPEVLETSCG